MSDEAPTETEKLRARAAKCRAFAKEYATDVGTSLDELAVELDKKADRLDRQAGQQRRSASDDISA